MSTVAKVTERHFSYLSKREQVVITRPENIHNNPFKSTANEQKTIRKIGDEPGNISSIIPWQGMGVKEKKI